MIQFRPRAQQKKVDEQTDPMPPVAVTEPIIKRYFNTAMGSLRNLRNILCRYNILTVIIITTIIVLTLNLPIKQLIMRNKTKEIKTENIYELKQILESVSTSVDNVQHNGKNNADEVCCVRVKYRDKPTADKTVGRHRTFASHTFFGKNLKKALNYIADVFDSDKNDTLPQQEIAIWSYLYTNSFDDNNEIRKDEN